MRQVRFLILVLCFCLFYILTYALETSAEEFHHDNFILTIHNGMVSLKATDAEVKSILEAISRKSGISIFIDPEISGNISIVLKDVPLEDALKKIATNCGLAFDRHKRLIKAFVLRKGYPATGSQTTRNNAFPYKNTKSNKQNSKKSFGFSNYVPNQLIVQFQEGVSGEEIIKIIRSSGASICKHIPLLRSYVLSLPPTLPLESVLHWFEKQKAVSFVEPNLLLKVQETIPNDLKFTDQWALYNTDQSGGSGSGDISAVTGWDIEKGSPDIIIAVIDTGAEYTHPDLQANIWQNPEEIPANGIDDDQNGFADDIVGWDFVEAQNCFQGEDCSQQDNDPQDLLGHGTHVAGIIAAATNNSIGIAGVSWNSKLMILRAGYKSDTGAGLLEADDVASAILYAANNGAKIINASWGDYESSTIVEQAISYAVTKDVLIVAAAGNGNTDKHFYPAATESSNIIAVGSTDSSDKKAGSSNFGLWVDISAPGEAILSTCIGNTYCYKSGTSMATPHVTGLAALLFSHFQGWPAAFIKELVLSGADIIPALNGLNKVSGRINIFSSLSLGFRNPDLFVSHFSQSFGSDNCYSPGICEGDMDGDGDVDGLDIIGLIRQIQPQGEN